MMKHITLNQNADIPVDHVVAIGNFDAVHLGHKTLIEEAARLAKSQGKKLGVLTLEPHPRRLFRPDDPPFRITPLSVKARRLADLGVDTLYVLPFDWTTAELPATAFVDKIIKDQVKPAAIVIGEDFHFGHNRSGDKSTIEAAGIVCHEVALRTDPQHGIISATRIRGLIQSGHIDEANTLLGWEWAIEGCVEHGDQRGRELGYPTANMPLGETIHPSYGVYAALVQIEGESIWRAAATNIGIRPMFEAKVALVEAHILDYSGDLYGKGLIVKPLAKIRDEQKFSSLDELIAAIERDCNATRARAALKPAA